MKIGVIGANGRLGRFICSEYPDVCTPLPINLRYEGNVDSWISSHNFDWIVNCGALTNVDFCENNPKLAYEVNAYGVRNLVNSINKFSPNTRIVQLSSAFVFDGKSRRLFTPDDKPNPINVYGDSKWKGEKFLRLEDIVVRTIGLYGNGKDFVINWLQKTDGFRLTETVQACTDLYRNYTYIPILGSFIVRMILLEFFNSVNRIYHMAGNDYITQYEFSTLVFDVFRVDTNYKLIPVEYKKFPGKAERPIWSILGDPNILQENPPSVYDTLIDYRRRIEEKDCYETL